MAVHHQVSKRGQRFIEEVEDMWTFVAFVWNSKEYRGTVWKGQRRGCMGHWVNLENVEIEKDGDEKVWNFQRSDTDWKQESMWAGTQSRPASG